MPTQVTPLFQTHSARQFVESISEAANSIYYVSGGRHVAWDNDLSPPTPNTSIQGMLYNYFDEVAFGKKVNVADVYHMATRTDWTANTVYDIYDHDDDDLKTKPFFVVSPESGNYHVFKCLNNNRGAPSTVQPLASQTSANDEIFITTGDNYQWKYMYTITAPQWDKFTTANYLPIIPNADVSGNAASGAVDVIVVDTVGSNYNAYANGTIAEVSVNGNSSIYALQSSDFVLSGNTNFYTDAAFYIKSGPGAGQMRTITQYVITATQRLVFLDEAFATAPTTASVWEITPTISLVGDGSNAQARALVNAVANSIYSVEVINRGQDYTFLSATVTGNTGTLDANSALIIANNAVVRPIISPQGGHGSDAIDELYGSRVGISVDFANSELGQISTNNSIRQIGLIKDPLFANSEITYSSANGTFVDGEIVTSNNGAIGVITNVTTTTFRLTDVDGIFLSGDTVTSNDAGMSLIGATIDSVKSNVDRSGSNYNIFNQAHFLTINITSGGPFTEDEIVTSGTVGTSTYVEAKVLESQVSLLQVTGVKGVFTANTILTGNTSGTVATITGIALPDLVDNSGSVIYIDNVSPIKRSDNQTETVKVILEF